MRCNRVVTLVQRHSNDSCRVESGRRLAQAPPGARILHATGKLVMPGGIDPHTHLSMPFSGTLACDDFERCAASAISSSRFSFSYIIAA